MLAAAVEATGDLRSPRGGEAAREGLALLAALSITLGEAPVPVPPCCLGGSQWLLLLCAEEARVSRPVPLPLL